MFLNISVWGPLSQIQFHVVQHRTYLRIIMFLRHFQIMLKLTDLLNGNLEKAAVFHLRPSEKVEFSGF